MSEQPGLISCKRVSMLPPIVEPSQAFIFIELIQSKVPRDQALRFAQRAHCQYDSTKRIDGPPKYRIIKSYADPRAVKVNGWMSDRPIITNDPIQLDLRRIKQQKDWMDKVLTPKFSQTVSKNRVDEENIIKIRRFYHNLDQKCNLRDLSPASKLAKIKAINNPSPVTDENKDSKNNMSVNVLERSDRRRVALGKKTSTIKQIDDVKINLNSLKMRFQQHCRSVRHLDKSKMISTLPIKASWASSKQFKLSRAAVNSESGSSETGPAATKEKESLIVPKNSVLLRFPMTERSTKKSYNLN